MPPWLLSLVPLYDATTLSAIICTGSAAWAVTGLMSKQVSAVNKPTDSSFSLLSNGGLGMCDWNFICLPAFLINFYTFLILFQHEFWV